MLQLARAIVGILSAILRLGVLFLRSSSAIRAENLVLRRQLARYVERGIKPRRVDHVIRVSLALFTRFFDWRDAMVNVRPATIVRWHRLGWRILWRWKCRAGRPPIPQELRKLIRRMASENPLWGEERIANELLVKLGIRVSPRTVGRYMPKRPPGQPRGDQRWPTFLKKHAKAILACDFFVAVSATFRMLYVFVVIEHGTRPLAHVNVTANPSAVWTLQQLRAVVGDDGGYQYLIHDRDKITDAERVLLARKARAVGRKALLELETMVSPDTLLRWHRRLIGEKWNFVHRRVPGRPGIMQKISALIMRMAQDNPGWGYTRIQGAPTNQGVVGSSPGCGLAMLRSLAGANPAQVTASHGPDIEPCRCSGNGTLDA
jgi:hypothetical protein